MHSHVLSSEMTGYQVTFIDLGRLMQDFPTEVQAIITRRLGLQAVSVEIELARNAPVFLNAAGAVVPLEDVHERVQADQAAQYDLYQFAMSQWR